MQPYRIHPHFLVLVTREHGNEDYRGYKQVDHSIWFNRRLTVSVLTALSALRSSKTDSFYAFIKRTTQGYPWLLEVAP